MDSTHLEPSKGSSKATGDEMSQPKQDPAGRAAQPVDTRETLENRLEFESLLADLPARFVDVPSVQFIGGCSLIHHSQAGDIDEHHV